MLAAALYVLRQQSAADSTCIGITYSRVGYRRPEDRLRYADIAMYRAKAAGKARFKVFDTGMSPLAFQ